MPAKPPHPPIIGHNNCSRSDVGGDAIGDPPEDSVRSWLRS